MVHIPVFGVGELPRLQPLAVVCLHHQSPHLQHTYSCAHNLDLEHQFTFVF